MSSSSSTTNTIPTTFLIISDTHNFAFTDFPDSPLYQPTPQADVLLHSGDLTSVGGLPSFRKALSMLSSITAELKLVIAGNHDLELDQTFWDAEVARRIPEDGPHDDRPDPEDHRKAVDLMAGDLAREAGVTYLTEGTHTFTLSTGATFKIWVTPCTPEYGDWAFSYKHNEDRYNHPGKGLPGTKSIAINPIPNEVDIVMTHGPPKGIRDYCDGGNVGCPSLLQAMKRVRPMIHCFGHVHEGSGIEVVDWWALEKKEVAEKKASERSGGVERKNDPVHKDLELEWTENPYPGCYEWRRGKQWRKGETTLAVNASIMDGAYQPTNAPWRIKVDLKKAL
ncbi:MAG: hypothetical protein Q9176_006330 [Flavoplaca citrina]